MTKPLTRPHKKRGRKLTLSEDKFLEMIDQFSSGENITKICAKEKITYCSYYRFYNSDPKYREIHARAREAFAEFAAYDAVALADYIDEENYKSLSSAARIKMWVAERTKNSPFRGEDHNHKINENAELSPEDLTNEEIEKQVQELLKSGSK